MSIKVLPQYRELYKHHRFKVCGSGRNSGKSHAMCTAILWFASRAKIKVVACRQHLNSIAESSKAQFIEILDASGTIDAWNITKTELVHKITGSKIIFKGIANNVASIKSIPNITILFIEEGAGLTKESWDTVVPTVREQGSEIWVNFNPIDRTETLAQIFFENEPPPDTIIIRNSYLDNPFISATSLREINAMKESNADLYRHIYLGEYLDTANLVMVKHVVRGSSPTTASDKVIVGVDIAKDGGDRTCVVVRSGKNVSDIRTFPNMNLKLLAHELHDVYKKYKPNRINIDSTGSGLWAGSGLEVYGVNVHEINFAAKAYDDDKYNNQRTEMYALARKYFDGGGTIPTNAVELERELQASYYTLDNKNRLKLIPKDEIRKKIGKSPDLSDAFCLSLICDGDMYYDDSASHHHNNSMLARQVLNAGMF